MSAPCVCVCITVPVAESSTGSVSFGCTSTWTGLDRIPDTKLTQTITIPKPPSVVSYTSSSNSNIISEKCGTILTNLLLK